jgi:hypothetical protein
MSVPKRAVVIGVRGAVAGLITLLLLAYRVERRGSSRSTTNRKVPNGPLIRPRTTRGSTTKREKAKAASKGTARAQ